MIAKKWSVTSHETPLVGRTFLIVDDRRDIRTITQTIIDFFGGRTLTADNGEEAIRICNACCSEIDLILMDVHMPRMNGIETVMALREIGFERPVIAISSDHSAATRQMCREAGFDDFIAKPFTKIRLVETLQYYACHISLDILVARRAGLREQSR